MTRIGRFLKQNLFFCCVAFCYLIGLIINPQTSVQGVKNSGYYIKEMLTIMPVIFIITALLDTWVPKETIIRLLGKESKAKGVLLSFVLGSISAGPIYAAFPFCVMLRKKGTSLRNIVIILSAWAVIKVPMLLNEAKFLGLKFMGVRWVLTVIAILIFSKMMACFIKEEDFEGEESEQLEDAQHLKASAANLEEPIISEGVCIGCSACTKLYPELFEMKGKTAQVKPHSEIDYKLLQEAIKHCPIGAISSKKV